jgi:predicted transcriptional regulator
VAASSENRVITAHVPTALADHVDVLATRLDRSRGWIVKQALADFVALEERRHRLTLEALADVDTGRVVDQTKVDAWLDSLDSQNPLPPPA